MNSDSKASCHELFKEVYILPLYSQYIFSVLVFIVKNRPLFNTHSDLHPINRGISHDLHPPTAILTLFQKGVSYLGAKIYNHLPSTLKQLSYDVNIFKTGFHSLEEYINWK
jgi:hypothetical protein